MTNKEIKFELAKVALTTCRHMTSESLSESLTNLYDWVMEEQALEPVWSKEDEKIANNFISQLGNLCTRKLIKEETAYKYVDWIKSLKDRVGCEANCTTTKENEDTTAGKDFKNDGLAALFKEVDRLDVLSNKNSKVKRRGYAKRFSRVCSSWCINTVKDLLQVGSYNLKDARNMGAANLAIVGEALYSLYGIDKW